MATAAGLALEQEKKGLLEEGERSPASPAAAFGLTPEAVRLTRRWERRPPWVGGGGGGGGGVRWRVRGPGGRYDRPQGPTDYQHALALRHDPEALGHPQAEVKFDGLPTWTALRILAPVRACSAAY
jgi:hypothetical protein